MVQPTAAAAWIAGDGAKIWRMLFRNGPVQAQAYPTYAIADNTLTLSSVGWSLVDSHIGTEKVVTDGIVGFVPCSICSS